MLLKDGITRFWRHININVAVILWNQSLLRSGVLHWMTSGCTLFCCFINAAAPSWWHRTCSIATLMTEVWWWHFRLNGVQIKSLAWLVSYTVKWYWWESGRCGKNIKLASRGVRCMILHPAAPPQPGGAAFKCRVILPEACQMDRGCSPPRKYLKLFSNLGFMQLSYEL